MFVKIIAEPQYDFQTDANRFTELLLNSPEALPKYIFNDNRYIVLAGPFSRIRKFFDKYFEFNRLEFRSRKDGLSHYIYFCNLGEYKLGEIKLMNYNIFKLHKVPLPGADIDHFNITAQLYCYGKRAPGLDSIAFQHCQSTMHSVLLKTMKLIKENELRFFIKV